MKEHAFESKTAAETRPFKRLFLHCSFAASLLQTPVASAVGFGGYVGSARVETGPSPDGELLTVMPIAFLSSRRTSQSFSKSDKECMVIVNMPESFIIRVSRLKIIACNFSMYFEFW